MNAPRITVDRKLSEGIRKAVAQHGGPLEVGQDEFKRDYLCWDPKHPQPDQAIFRIIKQTGSVFKLKPHARR